MLRDTDEATVHLAARPTGVHARLRTKPSALGSRIFPCAFLKIWVCPRLFPGR